MRELESVLGFARRALILVNKGDPDGVEECLDDLIRVAEGVKDRRLMTRAERGSRGRAKKLGPGVVIPISQGSRRR